MGCEQSLGDKVLEVPRAWEEHPEARTAFAGGASEFVRFALLQGFWSVFEGFEQNVRDLAASLARTNVVVHLHGFCSFSCDLYRLC